MRVVNASPLIVLSKVGRLDLLREPRLDIDVVTPRAVLDEVLRGKPGDPAVTLVPEAVADWLRVVSTPPAPGVLRLGDLDPGETAVLSVALDHPGSEVVLDDHSARREATRLGIACIGTVGLVLTGHRVGTVPSVRDALRSLRAAGLYISDRLFRLALDQAGE
jgi:predicted nucleic acid-binding protein